MTPPARCRAGLFGSGLALGFTLTYLGLIVLIPLATLLLKAAAMEWRELLAAVSSPRALAAYRLSLGAAFAAAAVNAVFGLLLAWVLERYRFPGRRLVDGLVDLPFALPRGPRVSSSSRKSATRRASSGYPFSWSAPSTRAPPSSESCPAASGWRTTSSSPSRSTWIGCWRPSAATSALPAAGNEKRC